MWSWAADKNQKRRWRRRGNDRKTLSWLFSLFFSLSLTFLLFFHDAQVKCKMYSGAKSVTVFLVQLVPVQFAAVVTRWDEKSDKENERQSECVCYSAELRLVYSCFTLHSFSLSLSVCCCLLIARNYLYLCTFEKCTVFFAPRNEYQSFPVLRLLLCYIFTLTVQSTRVE